MIKESAAEPDPKGAADVPSRSPAVSAAKTAARQDAPARRPKSRTSETLDRFHEEDQLAGRYDLRMLARLWPFVRPQAWAMAVSMVLLAAGAACALARPLIMRGAFEALDGPNGGSRLFSAGVTLAGVIVLEQALAFPQMFLVQLAGARAMADLRAHVFAFLHTRRLAFFDRTPVGRLVTRVTNDVDSIQEMFASGALNAVGDLIRLFAIVVILVSIDWQMALLAFAALPPIGLLVNWTRRRIRDAFREIRLKTARMNAYLNEQVSGMPVVQAYAREASAAEEFDEINAAYRAANNRSIVFDATLDAAIEMVSSVCVAAVLWWAGVHTLNQHVSFGKLFAFVAYIEMFFLPVRDLSARYTLVQAAMAGAERVFELLDNQEHDAPDTPAVAEIPGDPALAFALSGVGFSYKPEARVLDGVTFAARRGEKIALVGATGAGKSTVASLLLRLYEPQEGTIHVLGKEVRAWPRQELRKSFAVVPQDVFLFPGTVASNVAAGDAEPDRARVAAALSRIGALDVFERREGGIDAPILERGANLSAGERQLIAFARALYRDPPILVLDEATANIDSDTEARLQRALEGAMEGRSALIIAHRLSTIRAVDRIVVFHKGRVVEQGTHDELIAARGVYARLYRLQHEKEQLAAADPTSSSRARG